MDIEKLIESVRLCGSTPKVDQCKQCAYWSGGDMSKCIPRMTTDAATALSTLQAENEKLRADVVRFNDMLASYQNVLVPELRAEQEQVKRERDAAVEMIREWEKFDTYLLIHNFITPEKWRGQKED